MFIENFPQPGQQGLVAVAAGRAQPAGGLSRCNIRRDAVISDFTCAPTKQKITCMSITYFV